MLTTIDRYVLRQVATPLIATIVISLSMMLAERLVRLLDITLGKKNSFGIVFEMLGYLTPHYLATAIPAALFLGLLLGFSKLAKGSEIDAAFAAGIGLHRLARPVILLSMVFALFSLAVFGWLKPLTYYAYRSVMFDVKNVEVFYLAEEGVFMQSGGRTFILDKLNRDTREFEHIFLFDYNGRGENETLTAANGKLVPVPGQPRPVLRLNDGHRLKLESWPLAAKAGEIPMASVGEFEQTDTPLGKLKQDIFRPRGNDERELTLPELYAQLDTPPKGATKNSMAAEFHKRLVNIIGMLVLPFLALPFALGRARSQHGYRIGIAMVLIIAFHEIIEQGAVAVEASGVSPWLALWLPLGALAAFSFWRFFVSSFRLRQEVLEGILDGINNSVRGLWQRLRGKAEATP